MSLTDELNELKNTEIALIMNDGQAYRGTLTKFDKDTIVLENVYETSNEEIDWVESEARKGGPATIRGYVPWRRVTLPKLIARSEMVLRIWPWSVGKVDKKKANAKKGKKSKK